jgi:hypothetical protein
VELTYGSSYDTGRLAGESDSSEWVGAFDPVAGCGYLDLGPVLHRGKPVGDKQVPVQVRFIGGDWYMGRSDLNVWGRHGHGSVADALPIDPEVTSPLLLELTADPRTLMDALQNLGEVKYAGRSGQGASEVETYGFSYQVDAGQVHSAHAVTGTIQIGVQSHLLARVTASTTTVGADPKVADGEPLTFHTVVEFSDYGVPVHVDTPTVTGN